MTITAVGTAEVTAVTQLIAWIIDSAARRLHVNK